MTSLTGYEQYQKAFNKTLPLSVMKNIADKGATQAAHPLLEKAAKAGQAITNWSEFVESLPSGWEAARIADESTVTAHA